MLKERVKFDALFTTTKDWGCSGKHVVPEKEMLIEKKNNMICKCAYTT
jgi:hypothetical protein